MQNSLAELKCGTSHRFGFGAALKLRREVAAAANLVGQIHTKGLGCMLLPSVYRCCPLLVSC